MELIEWTNEISIKFLEIYQGEPIIWDPKHKYHKDKQKVNDAWGRISSLLNIPIPILKKKKEALMATFRGHLRRKKASIRSGAGASEIYKPIWFAYSIMESFLLPVYTATETINMDEGLDELLFAQEEREQEEEEAHPIPGTSSSSVSLVQKQRPKKRSMEDDLKNAEKQMKAAFDNVSEELKKKDDECELYGKLLAKKLRKLSENERQEVMYEIDGLLLRRLRNSIQSAQIECEELSHNLDHSYL